MLHPVEKQACKLELLKRWRIHNILHVSLLEQDITRKRYVNKATFLMEFDNSKGEIREYEVEAIWDSTVYTRESKRDYSPRLYYFVP